VTVRTRDWAVVDFYAELGVEPTASADDIAIAFRTLAKQLHPDRPEAGDAARFAAVAAAYEVLGDERLRHSYDDVRISVAPAPRPPTPSTRPAPIAVPTRTATADPRIAIRNGRRWLTAGVVVFLMGVLVCAIVIRLQAHDHARRAGRLKTEAVIVAGAGHADIRFTTSTGREVQVREPARVNPGTDAPGTRISVLYRPQHPADVVIDESTTARNITLWIVALKLLVGGLVFAVVGLRRLRRRGSATPA